MDFIRAVSVCLFEKYWNIDTRASRSEYWWFFLFSVIVNSMINYLFTSEDALKDGLTVVQEGCLCIMAWLLVSWYAVGMRRMLDAGQSKLIGMFGMFSTFYVIYFSSISLIATKFNVSYNFESALFVLLFFCSAIAFIFIFFASAPSKPDENEQESTHLQEVSSNSFSQEPQDNTPQNNGPAEPQNYNPAEYQPPSYPYPSPMESMAAQNLPNSAMRAPANNFNQPYQQQQQQYQQQYQQPFQTQTYGGGLPHTQANFTPFNPVVMQPPAQVPPYAQPNYQWPNQGQAQPPLQPQGQWTPYGQTQLQPFNGAQPNPLPQAPQAPSVNNIPQVNLTAEELQNLGFSKVNESKPQDKPQK